MINYFLLYYDALFNTKIIKRENYEKLTQLTKLEINTDNPEYKYTVYFFHKKFKELSEDDLGKFVNYIFFRTNIIKITCTDESFAIKLFQVLNDRGQDLSNSDLIKVEFSWECHHPFYEMGMINWRRIKL